MVWLSPYRSGTSKSVAVAAWPPTAIMFTTASAPSSAVRRSRDARMVGWAPCLAAPSLATCSAVASRPSSMSWSVSSISLQLGEREDVPDQVAGELDRSGTDERDSEHAEILSDRSQSLKNIE
jgi:hypothetical protein